MKLQLQPTGAVGAHVDGVDLRQPLAPEVRARLLEALGTYGVLFFSNMPLSPEQQLALADDLGTVNVNRFFRPVDGHPRLAQVFKDVDDALNIGGGWHTDHSYDQAPAMGSILHALETPDRGGDTLFASMYLAFDALSEGLQKTLIGLRAVHSSRHVFGGQSDHAREVGNRFGNAEAATQDSVHPVVIAHPLSGRPALYVNPGFTLRFEGWTDEESRPLLDYLYAHASKPEYTYRHRWTPGTTAFWDNRCTWHYALNDYPGQRRLMHRATLDGVELRAHV